MKCPLLLIGPIHRHCCSTYLPDRLLFKSLGLTGRRVLLATYEYGVSVALVRTLNARRDAGDHAGGCEAERLACFFSRAIPGVLRKHILETDRRISDCETRGVALEEYLDTVGSGGRVLFERIVRPKGGDWVRAGRIGELMARAVSVDNMIQSRAANVINGHYNALLDPQSLERGYAYLAGDVADLHNLLDETLKPCYRDHPASGGILGRVGHAWLIRRGLAFVAAAALPVILHVLLKYGSHLDGPAMTEQQAKFPEVVVSILLLLALGWCFTQTQATGIRCAGASVGADPYETERAVEQYKRATSCW